MTNIKRDNYAIFAFLYADVFLCGLDYALIKIVVTHTWNTNERA